MTILKSEFLNIVKERGFFHQCTDLEGLDKLFHEQKPVTAYIGFDCTAPSLHVGSLMQIMTLRWLQKCGHKPIVLMGGGTTKVGDPSGKDESRKLLDEAQIASNLNNIQAIFKKFIQFSDAGGNASMVNNAEWLDKLNYIEFLRDYGRHFSINRMLSMDSVKLRLEREQHLSFLEFNYMILQAYDFVKLKDLYDCRLQIGGSDQWGNIVNGIELYRHIKAGIFQDKGKIGILGQMGFAENPIYGLTTPLITTASGAKMGKTESGAIWLNADQLAPFDYWQFWRNTEDADVGKFLRFFTELPMAEIAKLEALQGAEINEAKKILATEATKLCHGEDVANAAAETARKTFEQGGAGDNLKSHLVDKSRLATGIALIDLLRESGMQESKGAARKLIEGGGAKLNDEKVTDTKMMVTTAHLTPEGHIKLSAGKKQHLLVKLQA